MAVVAIVPVDVYSTLNGKKPVELGIMWNFAYWSTQALTWLVLPFFQYYAEAGDFTVGRKCLTSLKENGILYGSVAAVGIIGIAILLFTRTLSYESLLGLGIGLSNAFGLISSILLLGYGLVSIPRKLWKSCPEMNLKWCAHRAARHAANVMRSTREMEDVVTIVMANERQLRRHDPLRKYMDVVLEELRKESPISPNDISSNNIDLEGLRAEDLEYNYDRDGLASLRRRMRAAINEYNGNRALYERVIIEAFEYEDVMNARRIHDFSHPPLRRRPLLSGVSSSSTSANNNNNSASPNGSSSLMSLEDRMAAAAAAATSSGNSAAAASHELYYPPNPFHHMIWVYKCRVRQHWHRVAAVILVITSLLIIWAESTIVSPVDISPLSLMIKRLPQDQFGVQILTLLPLAYICACTYAALFSINAFNYNKLIPHATTGAALMQNGTLMSRFAAPTCWNFYHMIRMTSTKAGQTTVFTDKMGNMGDVPAFLSTHLNTYLPLLLGIECIFTALNLWDKICNVCVSSKYKFSSDDVDDELTEKGRLLLQKEREAVSHGFAIAETLPVAFFELRFPEVVGLPKNRYDNKGSIFKRMFNRTDKKGAPASSSSAAGSGSANATASSSGAGSTLQSRTGHVPKTAAEAAAAKWLNRDVGGAAEGGGGRGMGYSNGGTATISSSSNPSSMAAGVGNGGFFGGNTGYTTGMTSTALMDQTTSNKASLLNYHMGGDKSPSTLNSSADVLMPVTDSSYGAAAGASMAMKPSTTSAFGNFFDTVSNLAQGAVSKASAGFGSSGAATAGGGAGGGGNGVTSSFELSDGSRFQSGSYFGGEGGGGMGINNSSNYNNASSNSYLSGGGGDNGLDNIFAGLGRYP
eukprot:CAMPEP_0175081692 /NCGR_PEP_ID=MMETSP0052_2-20121109/26305_1 /TAXON_ID=51329 ORGANISM="Polytomella parva, Strain SAG 63-3" /NCGR_SAMPLE_ID=MMETSP0052_2 /ASSEMBLY_ACC=CAM_ASM_000194 /LENGTH=865 /DNA_ID=CAMNT_0016352733 /DNA_START=108 /DNA_END=2702 /DNA_ORIENTATION=-